MCPLLTAMWVTLGVCWLSIIECDEQIIQQRCGVCEGSGLVMRGRYARKCAECGGFFPWQVWWELLMCIQLNIDKQQRKSSCFDGLCCVTGVEEFFPEHIVPWKWRFFACAAGTNLCVLQVRALLVLPTAFTFCLQDPH